MWVAAHWIIIASWLLASAAVGLSFVRNLVLEDDGLGISFMLAIIVIPLSIAIIRRFALDSLLYHKRSVTINADSRELLLRDPLWLDGKHVIPLSEISEVSAAQKSMLGGKAAEQGVLDLSSRAKPKHSVYVGFKRPVEFVRCGGPVLFDLIFTFMDPGEADNVTGMILEFKRPKEFLRACDQIGLTVVVGYERPAENKPLVSPEDARESEKLTQPARSRE